MRVIPLLAALLLLAAACGGDGPSPFERTPTEPPTPAVVTVQGTFVMKQKPTKQKPTSSGLPFECAGRGGFSDIALGMEVVLSADGTTLDVGRFGPGAVVGTSEFGLEECRFDFTLTVPRGHQFYNVKIGRRGRGRPRRL